MKKYFIGLSNSLLSYNIGIFLIIDRYAKKLIYLFYFLDNNVINLSLSR